MSRNTPTQTTPFDAAKYIVDPGHAALLNDAFESGDAGYIAKALGTIARSEGMTSWHAPRASTARRSTRRSARVVTRRSKRCSR
jgi:DNA-binding phage protein